jgi:hypothetical protein
MDNIKCAIIPKVDHLNLDCKNRVNEINLFINPEKTYKC